MGHDHVDVRIEGDEEQVLAVEEALGNDTITRMALAARRFDVMISINVSPYEASDDTREEVARDAFAG